MPTLAPDRIAALLTPYAEVTPALAEQLSRYLDLLLKWNARTNLTAIRSPEEIVRRHFGESLFAAAHLNDALTAPIATLLDLGSGAGLPGIPIQLAHPEIKVTLAESQNKKAAFLREAVRTLGLSTEVWPSRAESLPGERTFDVVTLRAVDNTPAALAAAEPRAARRLLLFTTDATTTPLPATFAVHRLISLPGASAQHLLLADRSA